MDQELETKIQDDKRQASARPRQENLVDVRSRLPRLNVVPETAPDNLPGVCPICFGSDMEVIPGKGAKLCGCREEIARQQLFRLAVNNRPNGVHGEWGWLTDRLNSIRTNDRCMEKLSTMSAVMNGEKIDGILDLLEDNAEHSFYIHGATGTYKTTLAIALMQEAGRRGQSTAYDIGRELIDTIRSYDLDHDKRVPAKKKFYSLEQLEGNPLPLCVVLDEIEDTASGLTAYTLSTLFRMIEKFKAHKQQLIATSNRSLPSLLDVWRYRDKQFLRGAAMAEDYCAKIDRRLQEHCIVLELLEN